MKIDLDEMRHIAALTKLGMTEEDISLFSKQLSSILESFEILNEVDTAGISPTVQPNHLCNVLRDDTVSPPLPLADVLANTSYRDGEFFRIQAVLE
jgi:aspartyl-tRNA(Asn)/glutamyl-tRNA(Gln) amidotransferase subunit C